MKRIYSILKEKWPEYFLEILVITIGILGAFALNSWNENRKNKLEERAILENLQNDLDNTIAEFEFLNTLRKNAIDASLRIFEISSTMPINPNSELDTLFGKTMVRPTYNGKMGTLELLFSTGKISLIQNEEIKEKLISWPGMIDDFKEEEVYANEIFMGPFIGQLAKYAVIPDLYPAVYGSSFINAAPTSSNLENQPSQLPMKSDYGHLLKNQEFLNLLAMRTTHFDISYSEAISLVNHANQLRELIKKELQK
ncbi:hypothetical protein D0X99_00795 [Algoriphagus lacus]|uniref:Uncharacterized protein n=1 Tax=Algoriphagus lacus TaxID=2056311 RepID=A0A418PVS5_9BACT|nr:DUF6090 family protein [Algoriphagus lacus]RIW18268.1 hypothetical protein D0X99_00795 [Algoriphagus lacus]